MQVDPMLRSRRWLRQKGWGLHVIDVPDAQAALHAIRQHVPPHRRTAILLQVDWREPAGRAIELIQRIRSEPQARESRIVFMDHYDGVTGPHFQVLPLVDAYVKKQLPRWLAELAVAPASGGRIAQYFRAHFGLPPLPGDEGQEHVARLADRYASRLLVGWNVGAADFVHYRLFRHHLLCPLLGADRPVLPHRDRAIDLHCRVGLGSHGFEDWYRRHRRAVVGGLEQLGGRWSRVLGLSGAKVGRVVPARQFKQELANTRICVSPFGYGEICYRDFEAVASGCALAKPDMSHLRTAPDIYIPHETYIPFRWDLSDLPQALEPYLADPQRAEAIAVNAREALRSYFQQQAWTSPLLQALNGTAEPAPKSLAAA